MIYLETSVVLAHILSEDRRPPEDLWASDLVSSRLLEYEVRVGINRRGLERTHGDAVRVALSRIGFVEMDAPSLLRASDPFPVPVRTLDALHLATASYLRERGESISVASYDNRMVEAARALGFDVHDLTPLTGSN